MSLHISSFLQIKLPAWDEICKHFYKSATNLFLAQQICEREQLIIGNIMTTTILNEIGGAFTPTLHLLLYSFRDKVLVVQFAKTNFP